MHSTLAVYAPVFNRAVAVNARSLIIVMALSFVIAPAILFHRSGRPLITHAVFSLHLYAFLLLLFCVANVIPAVDKWFGGPGLASESNGSRDLDCAGDRVRGLPVGRRHEGVRRGRRRPGVAGRGAHDWPW